MKKLIIFLLVIVLLGAIAFGAVFVIFNYQACGFSENPGSDPKIKCSCIGVKKSRQDLGGLNNQDKVVDYCYGYAISKVCLEADIKGNITPFECP
jgi:hypothetical protein